MPRNTFLSGRGFLVRMMITERERIYFFTASEFICWLVQEDLAWCATAKEAALTEERTELARRLLMQAALLRLSRILTSALIGIFTKSSSQSWYLTSRFMTRTRTLWLPSERTGVFLRQRLALWCVVEVSQLHHHSFLSNWSLWSLVILMIGRFEPPRHSDSNWVLSEGRSLQPEALPHVRPGKVRSHCWLW